MRTRFVLHQLFQDGLNNFDLIYLGNPLQVSLNRFDLYECDLDLVDFIGLDRQFFRESIRRVFRRLDFVRTRDPLQGSGT